jgi:hypothetical protein
LEDYLLALAFQSQKPDFLLGKEVSALFIEPVNQKILKYLKDFSAKNKKFSSRFFFQFIPAEIQDAFDKFYLIDLDEKVEDGIWLEKEIQKTKLQLQIVAVKEEIQKTLSILKKKENSSANDPEIENKLLILTKKLDELGKKGDTLILGSKEVK